MLQPKKLLEVGNSGLLLLVFITIFIIPILPVGWHQASYRIFFTFIFLISATAVRTQQTDIFILALSLTIISWTSEILGLQLFDRIARSLTLIFFIIIVVKLIIQIAGVKQVTAQVILEAINSYLLLGMSFAIIIALIISIDPQAFSFSEIMYFGFVTMTTLGYGDIVPLSPIAKSAAMLAAVGGQIYIAVIIALLVGKYASSGANS